MTEADRGQHKKRERGDNRNKKETDFPTDKSINCGSVSAGGVLVADTMCEYAILYE